MGPCGAFDAALGRSFGIGPDWLGRKDLNPHLTESESVVLPLDHSPVGINRISGRGGLARLDPAGQGLGPWETNFLGNQKRC